MKKSILYVFAFVTSVAFAGGSFAVPVHAALDINNLCLNEFYNSQKLIYAQDIKPTTPTQDADSAIINDRDGNNILTVKQKNDVKIVWPETKLVVVYAGEALRYEGGTGGEHYLKVDILNTSQQLVSTVIYNGGSNPKININQDGYLRFNAGEIAHQHNYLLLCGQKSSFPGGGGSGSNQAPIWSQIPTQSVAVGQTVQFTVFASDPNGDALTYSSFNLPSGSSFNTATKAFYWTPSSSQTGTYNVTFRVSDGFNTVDMIVTINVQTTGGSGSGAPVWNQIGSLNTAPGQLLQFTVYASDPNGDFLTYSAFNLPSGASFNDSTKTFIWYPSQNQVGIYTITFRVSDGINQVDMYVPISVGQSNYGNCNTYPYYNCNNPPYYGGGYGYGNQQPVWNQTGTQSAAVGQLVSFTVYASDPNGDYLTYSAFNLPSGSTFNTLTRYFTWTPSPSQLGSYYVTFRVSDGLAYTDMTVLITVGGGYQNQPPYGTQAPQFLTFNPPLVAIEGQYYSYTAYATSNFGNVTYQLLSAPSGMTINPSTGLVSWTPSYTQGGTSYTVTVQATNSYGSATKSYTLSVENVSLGTVTPPPPPASGGSVTPPPPTISSLTTSDIRIETQSNGDVIVSWKTNRPATARVIYDTVSQADKTRDFTYANATGETTDINTEHVVNLGRLDVGKTYYLRTVSKAGTEMHISNEFSFLQSSEGLAGVFGTLGGIPITTWIFIIVSVILATFLYLGYRKSQMVTDH